MTHVSLTPSCNSPFYTRVNTTPASPKTTRATRAAPRSFYQAEYAEQARKLCLLMGADDQELAGFFEVPPDRWSIMATMAVTYVYSNTRSAIW